MKALAAEGAEAAAAAARDFAETEDQLRATLHMEHEEAMEVAQRKHIEASEDLRAATEAALDAAAAQIFESDEVSSANMSTASSTGNIRNNSSNVASQARASSSSSSNDRSNAGTLSEARYRSMLGRMTKLQLQWQQKMRQTAEVLQKLQNDAANPMLAAAFADAINLLPSTQLSAGGTQSSVGGDPNISRISDASGNSKWFDPTWGSPARAPVFPSRAKQKRSSRSKKPPLDASSSSASFLVGGGRALSSKKLKKARPEWDSSIGKSPPRNLPSRNLFRRSELSNITSAEHFQRSQAKAKTKNVGGSGGVLFG